jgi:hypothetical protein
MILESGRGTPILHSFEHRARPIAVEDRSTFIYYTSLFNPLNKACGGSNFIVWPVSGPGSSSVLCQIMFFVSGIFTTLALHRLCGVVHT